MERKLSPGQTNCLTGLADRFGKTGHLSVDRDHLQERYNLTREEAVHILAGVALLFHYIARKENDGRELSRKEVRKLRGIVDNNPGGTVQLREEKGGFVHHSFRKGARRTIKLGRGGNIRY